MKVRIEDEYDGFSIEVQQNDGTLIKRVHIDQEDTREELKKVFETLGIPVVYEEVY